MAFVLILVWWTASLCIHEYAHARVAYAGGDTSVEGKGYLSFNPLRYADITGSLIIPLVFLLLGGLALPGAAVYIDRSRLRSKTWESAVSSAGPLSNLVLAIALAAPFHLMTPEADGLWPPLAFFVVLQIMAFLFNLLPVPGFDGYGIIAPWLPPEFRAKMDAAGRWSMIIVFVLFWRIEAFSAAFWRVVFTIAAFLGVPGDLAYHGFRAFQFWTG